MRNALTYWRPVHHAFLPLEKRLMTSQSANPHLHELVEELPMRKVLAIVAYVDRAVINVYPR
jgi:hypothetical protein